MVCHLLKTKEHKLDTYVEYLKIKKNDRHAVKSFGGDELVIENGEERVILESNEADHCDLNLTDDELVDYSDFWANYDSQGEPELNECDDESTYL